MHQQLTCSASSSASSVCLSHTVSLSIVWLPLWLSPLYFDCSSISISMSLSVPLPPFLPRPGTESLSLNRPVMGVVSRWVNLLMTFNMAHVLAAHIMLCCTVASVSDRDVRGSSRLSHSSVCHAGQFVFWEEMIYLEMQSLNEIKRM